MVRTQAEETVRTIYSLNVTKDADDKILYPYQWEAVPSITWCGSLLERL